MARITNAKPKALYSPSGSDPSAGRGPEGALPEFTGAYSSWPDRIISGTCCLSQWVHGGSRDPVQESGRHHPRDVAFPVSN